MTDDPLFDALRALPEQAPDPCRGARVRSACHASIQRRVRRDQIAIRVLNSATAAALCAYLASVLSAALRVAISAPAW
jgi:hypothetical protein